MRITVTPRPGPRPGVSGPAGGLRLGGTVTVITATVCRRATVTVSITVTVADNGPGHHGPARARALSGSVAPRPP
jgi:hypothetical protein